MTDNSEVDALAAELAQAGPVTITAPMPKAGRRGTLTPKGRQVARLLAVSTDDDQAVLDAMLDATGADTLDR